MSLSRRVVPPVITKFKQFNRKNFMKRIVVVAAIVMSLGLSCLAAEPAYLKVAGIDGEVIQKGREGMMEVLAWNHEVSAPYDAASGLATGKRSHAPLRVVIRHSKAIPLLAEALVQNKALATVDLMLWQVLPTGIEQNY